MEASELKDFRKKHNLTSEALAKILNVSIHTVNDWIYRNKGVSKKYVALLKQYDTNGLPVSENNSTIKVVSNNNDNCKKQIETLLELLKEKDKQITMLLNKL